MDEFNQLRAIEWHDLPLSSFQLGCDGLILVATPYNNVARRYEKIRLRVWDMTDLVLSIAGRITSCDLSDLEISDFTYTQHDEDRVSGTLGILPGGEGYWKMEFRLAKYSLDLSSD